MFLGDINIVNIAASIISCKFIARLGIGNAIAMGGEAYPRININIVNIHSIDGVKYQ